MHVFSKVYKNDLERILYVTENNEDDWLTYDVEIHALDGEITKYFDFRPEELMRYLKKERYQPDEAYNSLDHIFGDVMGKLDRLIDLTQGVNEEVQKIAKEYKDNVG